MTTSLISFKAGAATGSGAAVKITRATRGLLQCATLGLLLLSAAGTQAQSLAEALNATNLTWTTGSGGMGPWQIDTNTSVDGFASATSGFLDSAQNNWIATTVTGPTAVSFWWKISTVKAYGSATLSIAGTAQAAISGNVDWEQRSFYVPSGPCTVKWSFLQNGSSSQVSNQVWLDLVALTSPVLPEIVGQPTNQTVLAGSSVLLSASALGTEPFTFQWQRNGTDVPGATQSSYSISDAQAGHAGDYQLIVSNPVGVATSQVAALSVISSLARFTSQPLSRGAPLTSTVKFSAAVVGTEPYGWQWYSNGIAMAGAKAATLTLSNLKSNSYGNYYVVATNVVGSSTSVVAVLEYSPLIGWGDNSYGQTNIPPGTSNLVAVTGGDFHAVALRADGGVVCWGSNDSGQTDIPPDATNVVSIAAGSTHSLAVREDGVVEQWGKVTRTSISNAPPDATDIVAIARGSGAQRALALRADGTVRQWGNVLGFTHATTNPPPLDATNVVSVTCGAYHSLALRGDGTLVAWGDNTGGQLDIPASASNVVAISSGWFHNLALRADGKLVVWGAKCGGGGGDCPGSVPATATNIINFACGGVGHDLALRADGTMLIWGNTGYLQQLRPTWATNLAAVSASSFSAYGLVAVGPPTITSPLAGRSVVAGKSAYFYATAVGAWPLRYQWQLDGANLPGATNVILVVSNAQPAQAGVYSVVVSNALGSAASPGAVLTVLSAQSEILGGSLELTNSQFTLTARSPAGLVWALESSADLHDWSSVLIVTNASGTVTCSVPATNSAQCFFRLRLVE